MWMGRIERVQRGWVEITLKRNVDGCAVWMGIGMTECNADVGRTGSVQG